MSNVRNPFAVSSDAPTLADLTHLHRSRLLHQERLRNTRSTIDNAAPPEFPHLRMNPKKIQQAYEEQARIQRANIQMVEKMRSLLRPTDTAARPKPNQVSLLSEISAPPPPPPTLHAVARAKRNDKIMQDNLKLYRRIADVPPVHSRGQWALHAETKRRRAQNASRFPYHDPLSRGPAPSLAALHDFGVITPEQRDAIAAEHAARGGHGGGSAPANTTQRKRLEFIHTQSSTGALAAGGTQQVPTAQSRAWHALAGAGADPVEPHPVSKLGAEQRRRAHDDAVRHAIPVPAGTHSGKRGGKHSAADAPLPKHNTSTLILNPNASLSLPQMRGLFARESAPQTTLLRGEAVVSGRPVSVVVSELVTPKWVIEIRVLDLPSLTAYAVSLPIPQLRSIYGRQNPMFDPGHRVGLARALLASCCFAKDSAGGDAVVSGDEDADGFGAEGRFDSEADATGGSGSARAPRSRRAPPPRMSLCIDLRPDMTLRLGGSASGADHSSGPETDEFGYEIDPHASTGGAADAPDTNLYVSNVDSRAYLAGTRPPLPAPSPNISAAPYGTSGRLSANGSLLPPLVPVSPAGTNADSDDDPNDPVVALFTPKARGAGSAEHSPAAGAASSRSAVASGDPSRRGSNVGAADSEGDTIDAADADAAEAATAVAAAAAAAAAATAVEAAEAKEARARARQQQQEAFYAQLSSPTAPRSGRRASQTLGTGVLAGLAQSGGSSENLRASGAGSAEPKRLRESKEEAQRQARQRAQRSSQRRGSATGTLGNPGIPSHGSQQAPAQSPEQLLQSNLLQAQHLLQIQQQLERHRRSCLPGMPGPLGPGLGEAFPGEWAAAQAAQHTYDADSGLAPPPSGEGTHLLTVQLSCHNLPLRPEDPAAAASAAAGESVPARYANPIAFVYRRGAGEAWEFTGQTTECLIEAGNPVFAQQLVFEYYPESASAEFAIMVLDVLPENVDYVNQNFHRQLDLYKEHVRGGTLTLPAEAPAETGETLGSFALFATDIVAQRKIVTALVLDDGTPVAGADGSQVLVRIDAIALSYD
jgi:hypothetical protein